MKVAPALTFVPVPALALALGISLLAGPAGGHAGTQAPRTDLTIYVDGALLERGGLVVVLPTQVPLAEWRERQGRPNPAASDPRLDRRKPIGPADRRLSVRVSAVTAVVEFAYPQGGGFNYRVLPLPGSTVRPEQLGSLMLSTGQSGDRHPTTGERVKRPIAQDLLVIRAAMDGTTIDARARAARARASELRTGFLEQRYACERFERALACDATNDRLGE